MSVGTIEETGKSSFSEALEYGLLGAIQEAEVSKIKLSTYIKNASTGKGEAPQIVCIYEDDTEGDVVANYELGCESRGIIKKIKWVVHQL